MEIQSGLNLLGDPLRGHLHTGEEIIIYYDRSIVLYLHNFNMDGTCRQTLSILHSGNLCV